MSYTANDLVPNKFKALACAGCVFATKDSSAVTLSSSQAYFKRCEFKAGPADPSPYSFSEGDGFIPVSPISLHLGDPSVSAPFPAVAFEGVSFDLPKGAPPIYLDISQGEPADKYVYSNTPVRVYVLYPGVSPTNTEVTVEGNLTAALAVTPPLNRPFLSADDALLKQYQDESVCKLLLLPQVPQQSLVWDVGFESVQHHWRRHDPAVQERFASNNHKIA
jgi:hypothetical protein